MTNEITKPRKTDRRMQISEPLKQALDLIVTDGLQMDEAARQANISTRSLRLSLKRPHVLAYLKQARDVFIAHISSQNPRRLAQLRDQDANMAAAVQAARVIETLSETSNPGGASERNRPGVIVQIISAPPAPQSPGVMIDVTPNEAER